MIADPAPTPRCGRSPKTSCPQRAGAVDELRRRTCASLLLPKDAADEKSAILEVRAGTGGDEAALFAGDLFRMYARYADRKGWKIEVVSASEGEAGGYKEIIAEIEGQRRVRAAEVRDPACTGCSACRRPRRRAASTPRPRPSPSCRRPRRSTSTSTTRTCASTRCALRAPAASTSTRPNSAVRITHLPTGIVVSCRTSARSTRTAPAPWRSCAPASTTRSAPQGADAGRRSRKPQVGSGDRSERIRTYNFPQGRVTDHRINLTLYKLDEVMTGDALDEIIDALITEHQAAQLADQEARREVPHHLTGEDR